MISRPKYEILISQNLDSCKCAKFLQNLRNYYILITIKYNCTFLLETFLNNEWAYWDLVYDTSISSQKKIISISMRKDKVSKYLT